MRGVSDDKTSAKASACPEALSGDDQLKLARSTRRIGRAQTISIAPSLGLPLLLAACGGGGGGGARPAPLPPPPPSPPPTPEASADSGAVAAGATAVTGNVLANDTPAAGQNGAPAVSAVAVQGGAAGVVGQAIVTDFGTLTLNSNGSYSYAALDNVAVKALAAGQTHTDVFTYTVTNGSGSTTSTLNLTITGANDAPVAVADAAAITEDAAPNSVAGNVLSNDSDPDAGTVLAVVQVGGQAANVGLALAGTYGSLKLNADGSYTYTLDNADLDTQRLAAGQSATETFSYLVSDGTGGTAQAALTVTITGVNDAPVAVADAAAIIEDAAPNAVTGNVLANDSDADAGAVLAVVQVSGQALTGTYGNLKLNADGSYIYTLDNEDPDTEALSTGQSGQDVFSYQISDGAGGTSTGQISVVVNGRTAAVAAADDVMTIDASTESGAALNLFANDAGTGLQLSLLQLPNRSGVGGAFPWTLSSAIGTLTVAADGTASYQFGGGWANIGAGQSYTDVFSYTVREASGQSDSATLRVTISRAAERIIGGTAAPDHLVAEVTDTVLNGGDGNDVLVGSYGQDVLNGGAGNDRLSGWINDQLVGAYSANRDQFFGGAGDDVIVGGGSVFADTAIYAGKRADYSVQVTGSQIIVRDLNLADSDEGTDTLTGIELLQFSDQIVAQPNPSSNYLTATQGIRDAAIDLSGSQTFSIGSADGGRIFYFDPTAVQLLSFAGDPAPSWLSFDLASQRLAGTVPAGFEGLVDLLVQPTVSGTTREFDIARLYFYTPRPGDTVGTSGSNEIFAGTGGDDRVFHMGRGDRAIASPGADVYEGSPSENSSGAWPLLDYSGSDAAIFLDLNLGTARGGYAEGDVILNIGSIIGSSFADTIIGSVTSEVIDPGAGDDHVVVDHKAVDPSSYGYIHVWGGPGADVIEGVRLASAEVDYSRSAAGISVTMGVRASGGDAEGDLLINIDKIIGSRFDDVIRLDAAIGTSFSGGSADGGDGNDLLEGNGGSNWLDGGNGNDRLYGFAGDDNLTGGAGADTLDGGAGSDTVAYHGSGAVQIDLTQGTAHGGDAEGDTLIGIENIRMGGYAADILRGNAADNYLWGQAGNDQLYGMAGNDTLGLYAGGSSVLIDGGDGVDTFIAFQLTAIDLAAGTANASGASATLISIENVDVYEPGATAYGTDSANLLRSNTSGDVFLYGRGGDDRLFGASGNDVLAGGAGADLLDGFGGVDTASYAGGSIGVQVDLRSGQGQGGDAAGDTLLRIANLIGSDAGDILVGNGDVNSLRGHDGNDILLSIGGNDWLVGDNGDDLLIGGTQNAGAGRDLLVTLDGSSTIGTGGAGADTFVLDTAVNQGATGYSFSTAIQDFSQSDGDKLDLSDLRDSGGNVLDLQDILDHGAVTGGNLAIDLSSFTSGGQAVSGSVTLVGIDDPNDLTAADFIFSGGVDWQAQLPSGLSLT
ncbi:beta strand repeat-containing protein [Sphingomonas oleivorans]|nr:VCBS domain-containing protein [Sphingomonas oleivorans]